MQDAVQFAEILHQESTVLKTTKEQKQMKILSKMLQNEHDKYLATSITDQIFRSSNDARSLNQLRYIFNKNGMLQFVGDVLGSVISLTISVGVFFLSYSSLALRRYCLKKL